MSRKKFTCTKESQKRAIRAYYAKKAEEERRNSDVSVQIKNHKDYNGGHPHVIMDDIDDKHVSVGLTTQKRKGKNGGNNYALEKDPLNSDKQSYMRRQGTVAPKTEYEKARQGAMTQKDYEKACEYADKAKQKYLSGKKNLHKK